MVMITEKMLDAFNRAGGADLGKIAWVEDGLRAAIEAMDPPAAAPVFPEDLVDRLEEILNWRRTGVGELTALRAYANEKLSALADMDVLRIAEDKTFLEAARLIVCLVREQQA
jgi:hypothetical protein